MEIYARPARPARERGRRVQLVAVFGAAAVAALLGYVVVGGAAAPGSQSKTPAAHAVDPARSPAGAVAAATAMLIALGDPQRMVAAAGRSVLEPLRSRLLPGVRYTARGLARLRARYPGTVTAATVPLGWRLAAYTPAVATVILWHGAWLGAPRRSAPTLDYLATRYVLRWRDGAWRIEDARRANVPTPPHTSDPSALAGFASAAAAYHAYTYAP